MSKIRHKLGTTYFLAAGKNKKTPLVFLHGGPGSTCRNLKPILRLDKNRRVFIYDQLGCGKSSKTSKAKWTIKTLVSELHELVEKWGLSEFHLGGSSWGTTLALEYFGKHPEKVQSLIFSSPMFSARDWELDGKRLIKKMPNPYREILLSDKDESSKEYKSAMFEYYLRYVVRSRAKLRKMMLPSGNVNGQKVYEYMWGQSEFKPNGTLKKYDGRKILKKIQRPALFTCGQFDEATPQTTRSYARKVKGSKFVVFKGNSHCIFQENPTKIVSAIRSFLRGR